jgi:hypothetical protein
MLSHQYVDQLPFPIRQAVFGNVGTLIAFRIGHTDAEVLGKDFKESISPHTLTGLERYQAVLKLLENGDTQTPFGAAMLPPDQ